MRGDEEHARGDASAIDGFDGVGQTLAVGIFRGALGARWNCAEQQDDGESGYCCCAKKFNVNFACGHGATCSFAGVTGAPNGHSWRTKACTMYTQIPAAITISPPIAKRFPVATKSAAQPRIVTNAGSGYNHIL